MRLSVLHFAIASNKYFIAVKRIKKEHRTFLRKYCHVYTCVCTNGKGGSIGNKWKKERRETRSIDKLINKEGRIMINKIKEREWMILNGNCGR